MKRPVLVPALIVGLGTLISYYFKIPSRTILIISFVTLLWGCFAINKGKNIKPLLFLMIFLIAILYTNSQIDSKLSFLRNEENEFSGVIHKSYNKGEYYSYDIKLSSVDGYKASEKIRANLYDYGFIPLGTKVYFEGIIVEPMYNTNPGLFNYKQYLLTKKIYNIARIDESSIAVLDSTPDIGYIMQNMFNNRINRLLSIGLSDKNAALMMSLLTGDKDSLEKNEYEIYQNVGLAHILAISGLHIGILSGFILFILSRIGFKRYLSIPITLLFVWCFGYLIGFPESALRASLMITFLFGSKLIHRPSDPLNLLAASFIVCLAINPFWIFSIGFQLSYGATLSLVVITPWIMRRIYPVKGKVAKSLAAVAAVNIGLLPLQSYYFNQLPVMALLSNLILIPVATLNIILGFVMVIFPYIAPVLNLSLNIQRFFVETISKIPIHPILVGSPNIYQIIIYFVIIFSVLFWRDIKYVKNNIRKVIFTFLIIISLTNLLNLLWLKPVEIHFIDVGQGDAALIKVNNKQYLIDTGGALFGNFDPGESITLPYLKKQGIRKLDGIIISHFHEDHYKGIFSILDNLHVDAIYVNGEIPDEILNIKISEFKTPVYKMIEGSEIRFDNHSKLVCIWPQYNEPKSTNENNNSLVIMLDTFGKKVLFTGDIENEVEIQLIEKIHGKVDVLKVAHHGSATSSTESFIDRTSPNYSVISVGKSNKFGHPHQDVLTTLKSQGSIIYRTDISGLIKTIVKKDSLEVNPYGGPPYQIDLYSWTKDNNILLSWVILYYILAYIEVSTYIKLEETINEL